MSETNKKENEKENNNNKRKNEPIVKKKLSGWDNKKRKIEKDAAVKKNSRQITSFFDKGRCECVMCIILSKTI